MADDATLCVTATGAAGAAVTLTLPAGGAGSMLFLTLLRIELYAAAARAGGATPITVTSTGLPGNPAWTFPTAQAIGVVDRIIEEFSSPLRANAPNAAITIAAPVAASGIWRLAATYFVRG